MEPDSVPTSSEPLVKGVHNSKAVEGIVLQIELLVALPRHDHVQTELAEVAKLEVFVGRLLLEERY